MIDLSTLPTYGSRITTGWLIRSPQGGALTSGGATLFYSSMAEAKRGRDAAGFGFADAMLVPVTVVLGDMPDGTKPARRARAAKGGAQA